MDRKIKMPLVDRLELLNTQEGNQRYNKDKLEENVRLQIIEWLDSLSETNVRTK